MLTFFAIPKPFVGHIGIIQRNAIQSWLKVCPGCEVILFADEKGTAEAAKEFGTKYVADVKKNEFGTPLLDSVFCTAQEIARNDLLVYINSDMILFDDIASAVKKVQDSKLSSFLLGGRRWDIEMNDSIDFGKKDWENTIKILVKASGMQHGFSGIDYFVFPKNFKHDLPAFAVGRPRWDNWFIFHAKQTKVPVIDATDAIFAVHQNHVPAYKRDQKEAMSNLELAGGYSNLCSLWDADLLLSQKGLQKPRFQRRMLSRIFLSVPGRKILTVARAVKFFVLKKKKKLFGEAF